MYLETILVVCILLLVLSLQISMLVRIEGSTPFWNVFVKGHNGLRDICYPHSR